LVELLERFVPVVQVTPLEPNALHKRLGYFIAKSSLMQMLG
jgi:hypothetical protein